MNFYLFIFMNGSTEQVHYALKSIGIFWQDTREESAWLLEAKNFLGALCAHQNDIV